MLQNLDMSNYNSVSQFYIFYLFDLYSFRCLSFDIKFNLYYVSIMEYIKKKKEIYQKKKEKFIKKKRRRRRERKVSVNNILAKKTILISINLFWKEEFNKYDFTL